MSAASRVVAFAPGRVNLVGEHTDYNGGLALPFAIDRGVVVSAEMLREPVVEVEAVDLGERDAFRIGDGIEPAPGWRGFVRGTVAELLAARLRLTGARLSITATLPRGAGLSSSAALEVALCLALLELSGEGEQDPLALAQLCSRVENQWVGARTGLLDQLAVLLGAPATALRIDFRSLDVRRVPMDLDGWTLATAPSGERPALAASGYNTRRDECAEVCRLLGVATMRDASEADARRLPEPLDRRLLHVLGENQRVDAMVAALQERDLDAIGPLLNEAHASLREQYEVSTPAVEAVVRRFADHGATGSRLVGGGFGGQVLGILPPGVSPPEWAVPVSAGPGATVRSC